MNNKLTRRHFLTASSMGGAGLLLSAVAHARDAKDGSGAEPDQQGLVFLFQGDSITDGNRGRNADPNHIMGHGYAFAVASRVGADFPASGYTFYNRGVSGNTVADLQSRWQADTLDIQPDVLSILIGINDTNAAVDNRPGAPTAADFENGYHQLLVSTKQARPATLFVLGLPFVYPVGKRKENWNAWNNGVLQKVVTIKNLAKEFNAVVVDYPAVFNRAIKKAPPEYWIWDGIHPTVPAHELMAREWIRQVSDRLPFLKRYK